MNMRLILILLVVFIGASAQTQKLAAQPKFSGTWKGAAFSNTEAVQFIYELELKVIGGLIEGVIKKQNNNDEISINKILGQKKYLNIEFEEKVIRSKSKTQNIIPPTIYALKYNLKTGYLEAFEDSLSGMKIVFFKDKFDFKSKTKSLETTHWVSRFIEDYNHGISAPEKKLEELRSFVFKPIYFDVDKSMIKEEYHKELYEIIKIIKSHSDLRIQVIGHTDSDGSDFYNKHLSKRRAQKIIDFFTQNGLRRDRIVIDFKGELHPVESNTTDDGKRLNRRVDFSFI